MATPDEDPTHFFQPESRLQETLIPVRQQDVATDMRGQAIQDTLAADVDQSTEWTVRSSGFDAKVNQEFPGYSILHEIARGGMGIVYAAFDKELGREVAIKILKSAHAHSRDIERFVRESMITALLPHPSIPPIYRLGRLSDHRPFLVMKRIRGETLQDLLDARTSPADLPSRLLQAFEQIALAVGFAHSQGIVHRDLKPANVMVGEFGEVLVMDWGLAKQLHGPDSLFEHLPAELNESSSSLIESLHHGHTQMGSVMGTPAYMAPEQARGEEVDARVDVFSLGAILCHILTGASPYPAEKPEQVVLMAAMGNVSEAMRRLITCGCDGELIEIANRCIAPKAEDRYSDASAVAAAIAGYRSNVEERLRKAEASRVAAEAKAIEQRKRRRVQAILAGTILLSLLALSLGALQLQRQQNARRLEQVRMRAEREREQRESFERSITTAEFDIQKARESLRKEDLGLAELAMQQASSRFAEEPPSAVRDQLQILQADTEMVRELNRIRDRSWTVVNFKFDDGKSKAEYPIAFRKYGINLEEPISQKIQNRITQSAIFPRLLAALDDWLNVAKNETVQDRLLQLLEKLDDDPLRTQIRNALRTGGSSGLQSLLAKLDAASQPTAFIASLGFREEIESKRRIELLSQAWVPHPDDYLLTLGLGVLYGTSPQRDWYRSAEFSRSVLAMRPGSGVAWNNLANAHRELGRHDDALFAFQRAVEMEPNIASHHNGYGAALRDKGEIDRAIEEYKKACELEPNDSGHLNGLGILQYSNGNLSAAIRCYKDSIRCDPTWLSPFGNLAKMMVTDSDWNEYHDFIDEVATNLEPKKSSDCYWLAGQSVGAVKGYGDPLVIAMYRRATELNDKSESAYASLSGALLTAGLQQDAVEVAKKWQAIAPDSSRPLSQLAHIYMESQQYREAAEVYRLALVKSPEKPGLHVMLGRSMMQLHEYEKAIESFRVALSLEPNSGNDVIDIAEAMCKAGRHRDALKELVAASQKSSQFLRSIPFVYRLISINAQLASLNDPTVTEEERIGYREQALHWLGIEYIWVEYDSENANRNMILSLKQRIDGWLNDPDLAGIRDPEHLAEMPDVDRKRWEYQWEQVRRFQGKLTEKLVEKT